MSVTGRAAANVGQALRPEMKKSPLGRDISIIFLTTAVLVILSYGNGIILGATRHGYHSYLIPFLVGLVFGGVLVAYHRNIERNSSREKEYFFEMAKVLAEALGEKDRYTKGHSLRVTAVAVDLARRLGLRGQELDTLRLSAILHDIGKIGVPGAILRKAEKLSDEEWQAIRQHPENSERILQGLGHRRSILIRNIVRHHHERWDGKGYPDGIGGTEINRGARIIALADTYDAMTSDRPYRQGLSRDVALREIEKCAGSQFDPALAREFVAMMDDRYQDSGCR
jgi:HD-GYP domain-containing protein (c-di-GMP phosphodiesterase class II)